MSTKCWETKDGVILRIRDMRDSHLFNTIAMLEREHARLLNDAPFPDFQGEMAQYYAEQEWERMMSSGPESIFPVYCDLVAEAKRRASR
jgi:hypothetical protein